MIEVWRHHRVIGNAVVGGLVGLFLVLMVWNTARIGSIVSAIRQTQQTNTGLARDTHSTTDLIESCVRPEGACYQRAQQRTADAVSNINRVIILAAACSANLPDRLTVIERRDSIQTCVINQLADRK